MKKNISKITAWILITTLSFPLGTINIAFAGSGSGSSGGSSGGSGFSMPSLSGIESGASSSLGSIEKALGLGNQTPAPVNPAAASNNKILNSPECKNLGKTANAAKTNHLGTAAQIMNAFHHVFDNLIANLESCIDGLLSMFGSFNFNLPICSWLTKAGAQLMKNVNLNITFPYGMGGMNVGGQGMLGINPGGQPLSINGSTGGMVSLPQGGSLIPSYNAFANGNVEDPITGTTASGSAGLNGGNGSPFSTNSGGSFSSPFQGIGQGSQNSGTSSGPQSNSGASGGQNNSSLLHGLFN